MIDDRISAGQLRALGCNIPKHVPDCASVPRAALVFGETVCRCDGDVLHCSLSIQINAPFEWVETEFVLGEKA